VHTSPRRLIGQIFLCLAKASCLVGTNLERHHMSVGLAFSTSFESLAALLAWDNFALLEDLLSFA
jgi:hypothetical protein